MSSIPELPTQGSDVNVTITRVHLHPLCVLVEFWGKFSEKRTAEYERLAKDIQSPGDPFQNLDGNPGDQCLVQIDSVWYRCRVVSRNGSTYRVFLVDKGITFSPNISGLSWGKKEHFNLPPEVEFCVLANVLPRSADNKWTSLAHEFLKSLSGKSVRAQVQDVLVPHRTFLLHVPSISSQMYEMGFAKKLSPEGFRDFVLTSMQCNSDVVASPEPQPAATPAGERLYKRDAFMYPELPEGTVETVVVTEVSNPQRIFCQLKVFSQELKKLSEQLSQSFEGRMSNCIISSDMIGYPCATRGTDSRWYRSVLQQVFSTNKMVEVLNVDYGTKQLVQVENVRPLAAEFFRMPVVTYICALYGVMDNGVGWTTDQIEYLRSLLLSKTVIAKFEYQSISEGVHYITLYGDENTNINKVFGLKESRLLECDKALGHFAISSTCASRQHSTLLERKIPTPGQVVKEKVQSAPADDLPVEDLPLNSSVKAVVQHVSNPSEFWIQTQKHNEAFNKVMDCINCLYKDSQSENMVRIPTVGLYCAAKAEDGDFYRATVTEVGENQLKVFFVDYGNSEVVERRKVRTLPAEFQTVPQLALKCSLCGVAPEDGKWTQSASEFFINAVTDKVLDVHMTGKCGDSYLVQLTDPEGEKNINKLMCSHDFAEKVELQRQPKDRMAMQSDMTLPTLPQSTRLSGSGTFRNSGISIQTQNPVCPVATDRTAAAYKECMFPIGSVLDVNVSFIESPNDFWCQLVRNAGHLKLLMHNMQAHYEDSEFECSVETACVARHPDNRMWYRALVIHKHETAHVDVLFVDYGQTETVPLGDLRRIKPQFLALHGQAFRCSLLNISDHMAAMTQWNEKAVAKFHDFVETAASNFVILKCTIYAVMYSEQRIVFNIVDLETPFESLSTSLANFVQDAPPKKAPGPSFRLDTYYYSTHGVKTGSEEQVTVTCVNNINQFYCQLEKNAEVLTDLQLKVSSLCKQLENAKLPAVFGTMCFAKYTDGQWYRGQIKATMPALMVHFVDYGDTIEVARSDLLPVPKEAIDIMSVPVQAILCGLSDIPGNIPSEANSWFETKATECNFRALVVAREPNGKLLVELYCRNEQINTRIKKLFHIKMQAEEMVVSKGQMDFAPRHPPNVGDQPPKNYHAPKSNKTRDEGKFNDMTLKSVPKFTRQICVNGQRIKASLQQYKPPRQRQSCEDMPSSDCKPATEQIKPSEEDAKLLIRSESLDTEETEELPKVSDLPLKPLTSGMTADIYVSHCNGPLSFYVQFIEEEDELLSLVESLNDPQSTARSCAIKEVHPGDLIKAEFADDSSWYRAVVKELMEDKMVLVEFIDFGDTAKVPVSKLSSLHKSFLRFPIYSTHCMLSDAANFKRETVLDPEVVSAFKQAVGDSDDKVLKCQFIKQKGSVWEVSLEDNEVNVKCKESLQRPETPPGEFGHINIQAAKTSDNRPSEENTEKSSAEPCLLCYRQQEFSEGEELDVYISTIIDAQTFWCQSANSEELNKITLGVAEVGTALEQKCIPQAALKPGSPCIALFSDDHFWYRAEVTGSDGGKLDVLFVDYGNKSQVNITDVREIPPHLVETPSQAFLCELEGFDPARGSWDSSAADELSTLTLDKMLQLTIGKAEPVGQKTKWSVQVKCEGQVINERMKAWWKSFTTEDKLEASSCEAPLEQDPAVIEFLISKILITKDADDSEYAPLSRDPSDEHRSVEIANTCTADDIAKSANSPNNIDCPEDSLLLEEFDLCPKKESVFTELVKVVKAAVDPSKGVSPPDVTDDNVLVLLDENDNQEDLTSSYYANTEVYKQIKMGNSFMEETIEKEAFFSSLEENPKEDVDGSTSPTKEAPPEELLIFSDPDVGVAVVSETSRTSSSAAKMVPREIIRPTESVDQSQVTDTRMEMSKKTPTALAPPSLVFAAPHLLDVPAEQESEAGNVPQEEKPVVEKDSLREGEDTSPHEDTHLDADAAATEPHCDPVPSAETAQVLDELLCLVEESQPTAAFTGPMESNDVLEMAGAAAEEMLITFTCPDEEILDLQQLHEDAHTAATDSHCDPALSAETDERCDKLMCLVEESQSQESSDDNDESRAECLSSDPAEEMLLYLTDEIAGLQLLLANTHVAAPEPQVDPVLCVDTGPAGPQLCSPADGEVASGSEEELLIGFTVPEKEVDPALTDDLGTMLAEELTEGQDEVVVPSSGDSMEAKGVEDEQSSLREADALDVASCLCHEQPSASLTDTELQISTALFPDLTCLIDEMTCLVGDTCLGNICQEAGTVAEAPEQQVTPPPQHEMEGEGWKLPDLEDGVQRDVEDSLQTEEVSSAEDSFESLTLAVTHLSAVADVLPEQQSEE